MANQFYGSFVHQVNMFHVCAASLVGDEAAIYAMVTVFSNVHTEALLLVDANNVFKILNSKLHCPHYKSPLHSTVSDASQHLSQRFHPRYWFNILRNFSEP